MIIIIYKYNGPHREGYQYWALDDRILHDYTNGGSVGGLKMEIECSPFPFSPVVSGFGDRGIVLFAALYKFFDELEEKPFPEHTIICQWTGKYLN